MAKIFTKKDKDTVNDTVKDEQSGKKKRSARELVKWVKENYSDQGKSRPEAIEGIVNNFGISKNYAQSIVYSGCVALDGFSEVARAKNKSVANVKIKVKNPASYQAVVDRLITQLEQDNDVENVKVVQPYRKKK